MSALPRLDSLKPANTMLEQALIHILKLTYNISEADVERIHKLSAYMFCEGCVVGAETSVAALQTDLELRKVASAPSSGPINQLEKPSKDALNSLKISSLALDNRR